jgi:hypothetical protein
MSVRNLSKAEINSRFRENLKLQMEEKKQPNIVLDNATLSGIGDGIYAQDSCIISATNANCIGTSIISTASSNTVKSRLIVVTLTSRTLIKMST